MVAIVVASLATLYLAGGMLLLARRRTGYSHIRHTISELGERGSSIERIVAYGLFLPTGLLLLLAAYLVRAESPTTAALALCVSIGYIGAAVFPCDPGSPMFGSAPQGLHNLAGVVEYVGGGLALMTLAEDIGPAVRVAGLVVLGSAIALAVTASKAGRGLVQRVGEVCLFGGLVVATLNLGLAV